MVAIRLTLTLTLTLYFLAKIQFEIKKTIASNFNGFFLVYYDQHFIDKKTR